MLSVRLKRSLKFACLESLYLTPAPICVCAQHITAGIQEGNHCVLNGIPSENARHCCGVIYVKIGFSGKSLYCSYQRRGKKLVRTAFCISLVDSFLHFTLGQAAISIHITSYEQFFCLLPAVLLPF